MLEGADNAPVEEAPHGPLVSPVVALVYLGAESVCAAMRSNANQNEQDRRQESKDATNAMQCDAMQCNAMQCNAMQCNAMQCNAMQCNAMQCNAMQGNAIQCNAMQCNGMQCNVMQCKAMQTMGFNDYDYDKGQSAAHRCPPRRRHTDSLASLLPPLLLSLRSTAGEGAEGAGWKSRSRTTATMVTATTTARRAGLGPSRSLARPQFF
jgi:hypothetical protein